MERVEGNRIWGISKFYYSATSVQVLRRTTKTRRAVGSVIEIRNIHLRNTGQNRHCSCQHGIRSTLLARKLVLHTAGSEKEEIKYGIQVCEREMCIMEVFSSTTRIIKCQQQQ
jgi:hypothetical protein